MSCTGEKSTFSTSSMTDGQIRPTDAMLKEFSGCQSQVPTGHNDSRPKCSYVFEGYIQFVHPVLKQDYEDGL